MSRQEKLILVYVGLFCLGLLLLTFFWSSNKYYSNAYTPIVEKSRRDRAIVEQNRRNEEQAGDSSSRSSDQPTPAGFRERDIEKNRGDRFSTY